MRHPRLIAAVAVTLVTATAGVVLLARALRPDSLVPPEGEVLRGANAAAIGETFHFGFGEFAVRPGRSATVESIKVVGVPDGMEVVSITMHERRPGYTGVGVVSDEDLKSQPRAPGRAPDGVALRENYAWQVVVAVRAHRAGTFSTDGLEIRYRSDGRSGKRRYPYRLRLIAS